MAEFLRVCRRYFVHAAIFSFFMNLLMLTLPIYMMQIFERVITSRSIETLVLLTLAALMALFLYMILDILRSRLLLGAGVTLDGLAGPRVLSSLVGNIVRPGGDQYLSGLRDVAVLRNFLTGQSITSLFDSPWVPVYLFVIFMFHPLLGIMATLGAAVLFLLAWLNEKLTRGPLNDTNAESTRAGRYIDAGLRNAEIVNALGMTGSLTERWQRLNNRVIDSQVVAGVRSGMINSASRFVRLAIQILMLAVGASLVINQHVSSGIMIAATLILSRALAPVETSIVTWRGLIDARGAYSRLNELLLKSASAIIPSSISLPRPVGRLELDGVTFGIPGQDRLIIKGVSFRLEPGESLGLIGPSASGKSTLARLITGIWRPVNGAVRLDGADVSTWRRDDLGQYIGYLPQDIELFAGTVGENIARLRAVDSAEVIAAARRAHAHDMIIRLPRAYDTEVGEGGVALSAGQRQRIGLARALFGNPSLVILDEPNANLDSEGDIALISCLRELSEQGVTCVTITHKPSLLAGVTKLLVLNDGRVELLGPRAEVMARVTRSIVPAQAGEGPVAAVADRK
jgi:PrtD family type I secretion system ABC transporter